MSTIRTRIAPSPTGFLHIGTARTALFNYLFAKKYGGEFVLRIENTDLERSKPEYEEDIFEGLKWLGIDADESPENRGPYGPYRQSERIESYKKYTEQLLADGKAFYCFHSERELAEEKEKLLAAKKPPLHLCEFRELDPKKAETLKESKNDYIIRFKIPPDRVIVFKDLIRGELTFKSGLLGDFSIAKRSAVPLYNFAVVVDDQEMKISHVIRGEDHISNTPKQLLLIEALNFDMPQYAHLPLILALDRSKLSKRSSMFSISDYKEDYLPETLLNFMVFLGWNPGDAREFFSKEELVREFSLERVQKSGAIFDLQKLLWMNGEYIHKKSPRELWNVDAFRLHFQTAMGGAKVTQDYIEKIIALEQPRLKQLSEIRERTDYFFREPQYEKELLRWKNMSDAEIFDSLERSEKIISSLNGQTQRENIEKAFLEEISKGDKGVLLWPLRVALTGKKASPGPFEIMEILGSEEILKRIRFAKDLFSTSPNNT